MNTEATTTKTARTPNYTEAMVKTAREMYANRGSKSNAEILEEIGVAIERKPNSVRSKLVKEAVYVAEPKGSPANSSRNDGPTKKEMLNNLREVAPFTFDKDFDAVTKAGLAKLLAAFSEEVEAVEAVEAN